MRKIITRIVLPLSASLLCACASEQPAQPFSMTTQGTTMVRRATVVNVRDVTVQGEASPSSGLVSFAGAILGGIVGSKIGNGSGSAVASIGGAVAGGMAGQHVEQSGASRRYTELTVRFDNGDERTYTAETGEDFRVGDTVQVTATNAVTRISR
ncbi:MAG TPA: glycine zipper 2TM domain-containing protein [Noviherbaspirillum sp.]|nr:glycine zipper 2TM domain-containing protein [Noviherbaspirillum sp.]